MGIDLELRICPSWSNFFLIRVDCTWSSFAMQVHDSKKNYQNLASFVKLEENMTVNPLTFEKPISVNRIFLFFIIAI